MLTPAKIQILDSKLHNKSRGLPKSIDVQFNPTEYTLNKGAQIAEIAIPGLDSPILQFIRGQNEKLTLDLFFDTTKRKGLGDEAVDVRTETGSIYQLVKIQPETHAPPKILFTWGHSEKEGENKLGLRHSGGLGYGFTGVVESVQQKFELFSPKGVPLRATLSVTIREYKTLEDQLKELNLQSSDHTKRRQVKRGDTLSQIAAEEYDNPNAWRIIAEHNNITNPRRLVPGTTIEIPPLDTFGAPIANNA